MNVIEPKFNFSCKLLAYNDVMKRHIRTNVDTKHSRDMYKTICVAVCLYCIHSGFVSCIYMSHKQRYSDSLITCNATIFVIVSASAAHTHAQLLSNIFFSFLFLTTKQSHSPRLALNKNRLQNPKRSSVVVGLPNGSLHNFCWSSQLARL